MGHKIEYPGRNNYGLQYPFGKQIILLSGKIPVSLFSFYSAEFRSPSLSDCTSKRKTEFSYPANDPSIIICPINKIDPVIINDPVEINNPLNILTTLSGG